MNQSATAPFALHPKLASDTAAIGDLPLGRVLLMNDTNFPWLVLVPRVAGALELIDLEETAQAQTTRELALVARALREATGCDKLNIAAIGNLVPQLHVHIVARRRDDALWPKPVWGVLPPRPYDDASAARFIDGIRARMAFT